MGNANNMQSTLFPSEPLSQYRSKQNQGTEQVPSLHSTDLHAEVAGVRFTCHRIKTSHSALIFLVSVLFVYFRAFKSGSEQIISHTERG